RVPFVAQDGPPFEVQLSAASAYQGGALRVRTTGSAGAATVFGRTYPLQAAGGILEGYVGFGTQDPPGPATLVIATTAPAADEAAIPITILETDWTVDYITIPPAPPPDPDAPPPPPPPPDETNLLPRVYAGLSERRWREGWIAPLAPPLRVTGYFGEQRSFNGGPVQGHHGGTDFGADFGTPILATNAGVVVLSGHYYWRGNIVMVDHGAGVMSLYGHMQERAVAEGDTVAQGQTLGYVGSTGLSTGAHLHWELAVRGVLVDGLRWLDGSQGF
ncbi:MAG: M23 family metallopeptidase, partial [Dehalococcoidia bacterium]